MATQIQFRRGTFADWSSVDPILAEGEAALELDTMRLKFGDGVHHWSDLSYPDLAQTFVFTQASPSSVWVVMHGLGRFPSVVVVDSTGRMVEGDVAYDSSNQITATFSGAFSGVAYLN